MLLQPADVTYLGYYDLQTNGTDSTYQCCLASRYVAGDFRLLVMNNVGTPFAGRLDEVSLTGHSFGDIISATTNQWTTTGIDHYNGLYWEESTQRLWLTSSPDYVGGPLIPTQFYTQQLPGGGGATTNVIGPIALQNIGAKLTYGGVQPVPASFQSTYGMPAYVAGWGGYASLMSEGGGTSLGPTAFFFPDIAPYAGTGVVPSSLVTTAMNSGATWGNDWYANGLPTTFDRGWRSSAPYNYFDGGDPRNNPAAPSNTVNTSGMAVVVVGGSPNFQTWWPGYSVTVGGVTTPYGPSVVVINGVNYTVASVTDSSHLTLTTSAGVQNGVTFTSPTFRPPFLPQDGAQWKSPAPDGKNRWVWGDSHYQTAAWINGTHKSGLLLFPSLGGGECYYGDSDLHFDSRIAELHIYDPASIGLACQGSLATWNVRPYSMTQLTLPGFGGSAFTEVPPGSSLGGVAWDPTTNTLYVAGFSVNTYYTRIYVFSVNA